MTSDEQIAALQERIGKLEKALIEATRERIWVGGFYPGSWADTYQAACDFLRGRGLLP